MRKLLTFLFVLCCVATFAQLQNARIGMTIQGAKILPIAINLTSETALVAGDPVFIDVTLDNSAIATPVDPNNVDSRAVAISGDGNVLAASEKTSSGGFSFTSMRLYRRIEGEYLLQHNTFANAHFENIVSSHDGSRIVATNKSPSMNPLTGIRFGLITYTVAIGVGSTPAASAPVAITADGARVLYASSGQAGFPGITMYNADTIDSDWLRANDPDVDYYNVTNFALTPDGQYLLCGRSASPYIVAYEWSAINDRYELMALQPDVDVDTTVQALTVSDDGSTFFVAHNTGGADSFLIKRYDLVANQYALTHTGTPVYHGLRKLRMIGNGGRWLIAVFRTGGTDYVARVIDGITLSPTTTTLANTGAVPMNDIALAKLDNDFSRYIIAHDSVADQIITMGDITPIFSATKASTVIGTPAGLDALGLPSNFDQSCGYILNPSDPFGATAEILIWNDALAPYLQ